MYRSVGGILMPFEGPFEPPANWLPGVEPEMEREAEALFNADPCGKLAVAFAFQPKAVRLKYLQQAGYSC